MMHKQAGRGRSASPWLTGLTRPVGLGDQDLAAAIVAAPAAHRTRDNVRLCDRGHVAGPAFGSAGREAGDQAVIRATDRSARGVRALFMGRLCRGCGQAFDPRRPSQLSCSPACRALASRVRQADGLRAVLDALDRGAVGEARGELRRLLASAAADETEREV